MAYFPFMIDISNQICLVVGGGKIAFHKVKLLSGFDVHIKVVGTEICRELSELVEERRIIEQETVEATGKQQEKADIETEMKTGIELVQRKFRDSDLDGMDFVIAATDDEELNDHISDLCKQRKILVNVVDRKEACSFIFPAIIQEKDLLVAVSTGGHSPAAAAYVKKKIKNHIPKYYGEMIETLGEYREYVLEHVDTAKKRKEIFNKLLEYGDSHEGKIEPEIVRQMIAEVNG